MKEVAQWISDFCDSFSLKNLITGKTCFKGVAETSEDVMLRNKPRSFKKQPLLKNKLFHFFHTHFARLPPTKLE